MEWNNPVHFIFHLLAQPWWLQLWIGWMIVLNTASAPAVQVPWMTIVTVVRRRIPARAQNDRFTSSFMCLYD